MKKIFSRIIIFLVILFALVFIIFSFRIIMEKIKVGNNFLNENRERVKENEYLEKIDQYALNYYKNKYNIEAEIKNKKQINIPPSCSSDICSEKTKKVISILLTNNDEIIYDHTSKQYADNREYDLIISEINNYYNKVLDDMKTEFNNLGSYSHIEKDINIEGRIEFSFYSEEENELQSEKKLYFHNKFLNAEQFIKDEGLYIFGYSKKIICDNNTNCKNIVRKYADILYNKLKAPRIYIEFELIDPVQCKITGNYIYITDDEPFAKYTITKDGIKIE